LNFVNKEKISGYQLFSLLLISRLVSASLLNPTFNLIKTPALSWVNEIIAGILAIALVGVIVYLGQKFPDKTIIGYAQILLGSVTGKILGVFLVLSFFLVAATDMRILGETLITTILPEIPILVFIITTLILVAWLSRSGLEANGRVAGFLMPMMIILLLLIGALACICSISDFSYLSPFFLPEGPRELILPTCSSLSSYAHFLVLGMIIPFVNVPSKSMPISIGSILMVAFLLTLQSLIVTAFFGPLMNTLTFPTFVLAQNITLGDFFERFEVMIAVLWNVSAGIKAALFLWAAAVGLAEILNLKRYDPLIYVLGALLVPISMLSYDGLMDVINVLTGSMIVFTISFVLFILLTLLIAFETRKYIEGRDSNGAQG